LTHNLALLRIACIRRSTLSLIVVAGTLNYFDRGALSIALPLIRDDLGLSVVQSGILLSAFQWSYALAQLPVGVLVDRFGARRILSGGMFFWSLAQIASGVASSFGQLWIFRALLGIGESSAGPSAQRVTVLWYEKNTRGKTTGIWNSVSSLGPALAPPLLTTLMLAFGWRVMFVILGVAGIVLAGIWYALYRDPAAKQLTLEEQTLIPDDGVITEPITLQAWRQLFGFRSTWALIAGYFGLVYMAWLWHAWLPSYLEMQHHMSIEKVGWVASIPFLFGIVGSFSGGWLSDYLVTGKHIKNEGSPIKARRFPLLLSLFGTALCTLLAAKATGEIVAVASISGAMFFTGASSAAAWTLVAAVAPPNCLASLSSIQTCGGFIGGALAPIITGVLVQHTQNFELPLLLSAAIGIVAIGSYLLVRTSPIDLGTAASDINQVHKAPTSAARRLVGNAATK